MTDYCVSGRIKRGGTAAGGNASDADLAAGGTACGKCRSIDDRQYPRKKKNNAKLFREC